MNKRQTFRSPAHIYIHIYMLLRVGPAPAYSVFVSVHARKEGPPWVPSSSGCCSSKRFCCELLKSLLPVQFDPTSIALAAATAAPVVACSCCCCSCRTISFSGASCCGSQQAQSSIRQHPAAAALFVLRLELLLLLLLDASVSAKLHAHTTRQSRSCKVVSWGFNRCSLL